MPLRSKYLTNRRLTVAGVLAIGALGAACSLALDFSGIDDGVRDGGLLPGDGGFVVGEAGDGAPDAPLTGDDGGGNGDDGAPPAGEAGIVDAGADGYPDGPCGALPGPAMVEISGTFCIDSTEVTIAQYTDFLAAKGGVLGTQAAVCSWNNSLVPGGWPPATGTPPAQPVAGTNWCQANLYCAWAGKRLCGTPDGTPADPNGYTDPAQSLWFNACTHNNDGLHTYPYGNTYQPGTCNGAAYDAGKPLPSLATCVGGYPGLFDLSGNVFEWEDRCQPAGNDAGAQNDFCFTRGGAFDQDPGGMECSEGLLYTRQSESGNIGFRCCAFPPDAGP